MPAIKAKTGPSLTPWATVTGIVLPLSMPFGTMMNPEICSPRDTVISPTVKLVALTQSAAALSDKNKKILFAVIMIVRQ
jgi:hypothetical protein